MTEEKLKKYLRDPQPTNEELEAAVLEARKGLKKYRDAAKHDWRLRKKFSKKRIG